MAKVIDRGSLKATTQAGSEYGRDRSHSSAHTGGTSQSTRNATPPRRPGRP